MSPRSRAERALSIKRIFSRAGSDDTTVQTSVVSQRGINAGGNVTGISQTSNPDDVELIKHLKQENVRLGKRVEDLEAQVQHDWENEYDRGFLGGLRRAYYLVTEAEGRPGKRQLAEMLHGEIRKTETGAETRVEGVED